MGALDGVVAIITGGAQGIGREHALLFGREGASVVVNDLHDATAVVAEITAAGGTAVAHHGDVTNWDYAHDLVASAVKTFGSLDALVNNAGGADMSLASNLTEAAWDREIQLNLKGMFCPTRAALGWWQSQRAAGAAVRASVVSTTSGAGLFGNAGQSPYGAAKAGIAAFTVIAAMELAGTGIRLNAVAPAARTPATEGTGGVLTQMMSAPPDASAFDAWHPGNISPVVAYLSMRDCPFSGEVFHVRGGMIGHFRGWTIGDVAESDHRLSVEEVAGLVPPLVVSAPDRRDAGGAAYAKLQAAWSNEQKAKG